ncbi:MAG: DUF1491 family protein [Proteobacteria bacterium]|nr:DUF1491 family protein [Pseudomonadota bacterium]MDA0915320.1 DUF1491 family protein [Pseudomonadota bacterium]MDA1033413.1 DUF1491 family protein [Pseudomonadota bacterium]
MDARLPAHLEISAIIRLVEAAGGFAVVTAKGERDAGTILILTFFRDENAVLFEKMPQLDGSRPFVTIKQQSTEKKQEIFEYIERRKQQDPDIWVLEADIADGAQFIASLPR